MSSDQGWWLTTRFTPKSVRDQEIGNIRGKSERPKVYMSYSCPKRIYIPTGAALACIPSYFLELKKHLPVQAATLRTQ